MIRFCESARLSTSYFINLNTELTQDAVSSIFVFKQTVGQVRDTKQVCSLNYEGNRFD